MFREIELAIVSALLTSAALAKELVKAGFGPDCLRSPEARDLARLILRVRDACGDVTEAVEDQLAEVSPLELETAHLLDAARCVPCPKRQEALAFLAMLELSAAAERLGATAAKADDLLDSRPSGSDSPNPYDRSHGAVPPPLRRVHLPEPAAITPGTARDPQIPEDD